jgi:hypothetical protein
MNSNELKIKLHDIFKKYRDEGIFGTKFKDNINQYYVNPKPEIYIDRMVKLVEQYDSSNVDVKFKPFILEIRKILIDNEYLSADDFEEDDVSNDKCDVEQVESESETDVVKEEAKVDDEQVDNKKDDVSTKDDTNGNVSSNQEVSEKTNSIFEQNEVDIEVSKPVVNKPKPKSTNGKKPIVKSKRTGKHDIVDLTPRNVKFMLPNGLVELFDKTFFEVAKNYLLSSGVLTDEEAILLSEVDNNASIYRDYDFQLTRSDMFIMLILMGMIHMNVYVKDETIRELFDGNNLKISFYENLLNTNLVELDVQSRVRDIQKKVDSHSSDHEYLKLMLTYLLLERANVPKDQNRETVKKVLDTSSVMNQSMDAVSVLDGVVKSKILTLKDYKRVRGE